MEFGGVFPGQGSQRIGMGKFLFDNFPTARQTFEEASDTLKIDFKKLCFEGPESDLTLTANLQPALLLVSTATTRVVQEIRPVKFKALSGHSIGEYAAVVTAGALKFTDALKAVRARGEAMQAAVPVGQGAMLAVMGLDAPVVKDLCIFVETQSGLRPVEIANDNAPGQIVISGSAKAIDWIKTNFKAEAFNPEIKRIKFIPLNVSAPFHCSLMKPAEDRMRSVLTEMSFTNVETPVVQNFTATAENTGNVIRENLIRQVSGSVRWVDCVKTLKSLGVTHLLELGAGKVLSGLIKKIDGEAFSVFNINSLDDLGAVEKL